MQRHARTRENRTEQKNSYEPKHPRTMEACNESCVIAERESNLREIKGLGERHMYKSVYVFICFQYCLMPKSYISL